jgi:hypothetical protein
MTVLQGKRLVPFGVRRAAASGGLQIAPSMIRLATPGNTQNDTADLLRERRRRRIWDINANVHCSIIGTCFSTAELRSLLIRLKLDGAETPRITICTAKGWCWRAIGTPLPRY